MHWFDYSIIRFLDSFAGRSPAIDSALVLMSRNVLFEGGFIVVLFWWAWAQTDGKNSKEREILLFGLFASATAVLLARIFALSLPFRARPLHAQLLNFKLAYSMNPAILMGWSSFPSDHAAVFFCLAMSLWLVSKRLGAVALVYAVLGVSFPRVYLGIHFPTDMLAGAALGIGVACLVRVDWLRNGMLHPALYWQDHYPGSFAAFLFLCSFEIAEEFNSARVVANFGYHGLSHVLHTLR